LLSLPLISLGFSFLFPLYRFPFSLGFFFLLSLAFSTFRLPLYRLLLRSLFIAIAFFLFIARFLPSFYRSLSTFCLPLDRLRSLSLSPSISSTRFLPSFYRSLSTFRFLCSSVSRQFAPFCCLLVFFFLSPALFGLFYFFVDSQLSRRSGSIAHVHSTHARHAVPCR
jgi:hypothetical protein